MTAAQVEDAGAAAEEALAARRPRPGATHLQDLRRALGEDHEVRLAAPDGAGGALLPFRRQVPAVSWMGPPA